MTIERPKVVRTCGAFTILTSKYALRHSGVHFLNNSTSRSAPTLTWFAHFDFRMCFAPQSRALFRHLIFQKCSETEVFLSFFTSKCALRHSGAQFLISYLARRLRTRHFITLMYLDLLSSDSFSSLAALTTVLSPLLHAATASGSLTSKLPSISPLAHPEQALLIFAVLDNLAPLLLEACSIPMLHQRLNRKNQLLGRD